MLEGAGSSGSSGAAGSCVDNASSTAGKPSVSKGQTLVLCGLKLSSRNITAVLKKKQKTLTCSNDGHVMKINSFQLLYYKSRSLVDP